MSKQRAKGTRWETELLTELANIFPHVERAPLKGANDQGDFLNVNDWLLEAKNHKTPKFLAWADTCRTKTDTNHKPWAVLWHGDRRTRQGRPLALLDLDTFLELLEATR